MRLVVTNAHKNPIIFDSPWMHAEKGEEAHLIINNDEAVDIGVPSLEVMSAGSQPLIIDEPSENVRVGIEREADHFLFYIEISSDATESTERIYEREIYPKGSE